MQYLTVRNWLATLGLAFIGYVGYFLTVTGAAIFCGPVIAPAFLGLVPIVLAIVGNRRQEAFPNVAAHAGGDQPCSGERHGFHRRKPEFRSLTLDRYSARARPLNIESNWDSVSA